MKKSVQVVEVENEGLVKLMDEVITLMCMNYFYTGKLIGVNETCVLIQNPKIIYETGKWSDGEWADAQELPCEEFYISINSIESFGVLK